MEYTKDIILDVGYKRKLKEGMLNKWTNQLKGNKFVFATITILIMLITIDIVLVSSFLNVLTNLY